MGNILNGSGPLGYAKDLTNPKRYSYPANNYISFEKEEIFEVQKKKRWKPPVEKQVNLRIAIPEGNHFYLNKGSGYGSAFGF